MEEANNLQEWELLSDSDSNSQIAFEEIIHADYFSLDSTKLHPKDQGLFLSTNKQLGLEGIEFAEENLMGFQPKTENFDHDCELGVGEVNKGCSFLRDESKMEVGIEGSELKDQNSYVIDSEHELGGGEINEGGSFIVDDSNMEVGIEGLEMSNQNSFAMDSEQDLGAGEIDKGGPFLVDDSKLEVGIEEIANGDSVHEDDSKMDLGFEEIELENQNCYAIDSKHEPGIREIEKGDSLLVDDSKMEVDIEDITNEESLSAVDSKTYLGSEGTELEHENAYAVESKHKLGLNEILDGDFLLVDDSKVEEGVGEINTINQNSQEVASDSSVEMSNSESISINDGEKKVKIWCKLPLDMIKLFASRMRPVWSISITAAFIGILMLGRRLYQMKHKSRRIPLKISFEDKKAASQLLLRAARLNEVIVRRMPVVRSPLLLAGGMTPWSVGGQL